MSQSTSTRTDTASPIDSVEIWVNISAKNRQLPWSQKLSWAQQMPKAKLNWAIADDLSEPSCEVLPEESILRRQSRINYETVTQLVLPHSTSHVLILNHPISHTVFQRLIHQLDDDHPVIRFRPVIPYSIQTDVVAELVDLERFRRFLGEQPLSTRIKRHLAELIRAHKRDFERIASQLGLKRQLFEVYQSLFAKPVGKSHAFVLKANDVVDLEEYHKMLSGKIAPIIPSPPNRDSPPVMEDWGTSDDHLEYFVDRVEEFFQFPSVISVLISNRCNLRCPACPIWGPEIAATRTTNYYEETKFMDEAQFEQIARETGEHHGIIKIGNIEEPLLHQKIVGFVKIAKKHGARVHFTSNGTLMTRENAKDLLEAGLTSVFFSLDSVTPEVYSKVRGWKFDRVLKNVLDFIDLRNKINPDVTVKTAFILQPSAWKEVDAFVDFWIERADGVIVYVLGENKNGINFSRHTFLPLPERHTCPSPWKEFYIIPEGDVLTCCEADLQLSWKGIIGMGSMKRQTIKEIWKNPLYQDFRRRHIQNRFLELPKLCQDCNSWGSDISASFEWNGRKALANPWACAISKN